MTRTTTDPAGGFPRPARAARATVPGRPGPVTPHPGPGGKTSALARPAQDPRAGADPQTPAAAASQLALDAAAGRNRETGLAPAGRSLPGSADMEAAETGTPAPGTRTAHLDRAPVPDRGRAEVPAGASACDSPPAGSRTWTIALPAGMKLLSLNDRGHWATRYRRSQAFKEAAWAMALHDKIPRLERVFVAAVYQPPPDWRERDGDNPVLSVKAAIDGLVAAKVLPGDECPRYVTGVYCTIGEPYPGGRMVLNLLPADPVRAALDGRGLVA